jgi:hypothetical protein
MRSAIILYLAYDATRPARICLNGIPDTMIPFG